MAYGVGVQYSAYDILKERNGIGVDQDSRSVIDVDNYTVTYESLCR